MKRMSPFISVALTITAVSSAFLAGAVAVTPAPHAPLEPQSASQPTAPPRQAADLVPVSPDGRVAGSWAAMVSGDRSVTHQVEIIFFPDGKYANRLTFWRESTRGWVGGTVGTYKLFRGASRDQWLAQLTPTALTDDTPDSAAPTFAAMGLPFSRAVWLTLDWVAGMRSQFSDLPASLNITPVGNGRGYSLQKKGDLVK